MPPSHTLLEGGNLVFSIILISLSLNRNSLEDVAAAEVIIGTLDMGGVQHAGLNVKKHLG